jgi:hypothetical protein
MKSQAKKPRNTTKTATKKETKTPIKKINRQPRKVFDKKFIDEAILRLPDLFSQGQTLEEVCVHLKVSPRKFYYLLEEFPELAEAYEYAKVHAQAWWANVGRLGATGKIDGFNATCWKFNMQNRLGWTDKSEQKQEINISDVTPWDSIEDVTEE